MEVILIALAILILLVLRALAVIRLRKKVVVPPAHPRHRDPLDADWRLPQ